MAQYWLVKSEPTAYSIDDLQRDKSTSWEGIRNYQARNYLREMKPGDGVLVYASSAKQKGVTGLAKVGKAAYADPTAFKKGHEYFDEKSRREEPTWFAVELRFAEKFKNVVLLETLKKTAGLENMALVRKGQRLSVMPLALAEWEIVCALGRA